MVIRSSALLLALATCTGVASALRANRVTEQIVRNHHQLLGAVKRAPGDSAALTVDVRFIFSFSELDLTNFFYSYQSIILEILQARSRTDIGSTTRTMNLEDLYLVQFYSNSSITILIQNLSFRRR
jgi:hypothetical protein